MHQSPTVGLVSLPGELVLPVRTGAPTFAVWIPAVLRICCADALDTGPAARGTLTRPAPEPLTATLRVHNSAGVPIAEGRVDIDAGVADFIIDAIRPIGLDAYIHLSETRRREIIHRVWSRCAYGTLSLDVAGPLAVAS